MGIFDSFINGLTGKTAEDEANRAINTSTERARRELAAGIEQAGLESRIGAGRASMLLGTGANEASNTLAQQNAISRGLIESGLGEAREQLSGSGGRQLERIERARSEGLGSIGTQSDIGLADFSNLLNLAGREFSDSELAALQASREGFGSAQALGADQLAAGEQGLTGLQQLASSDSPFLDAKLARAQQGVDADLARRGLFGSTGGAEVAAEARRRVLEGNEAQRIQAINQLAGIGVNQTGTQQNLATQQGLTEAQIAQATAGNQANLLNTQAGGILGARTGRGEAEANINTQLGLAEANSIGNTGSSLANLGLQGGEALSGLSNQLGTNLANIQSSTGNQQAQLQSNLGTTLANQQMGLGSGLSDLSTARGAGIAQTAAGRSRAATGLATGVLGAIGSAAGGMGK
jgi:hypothetical protein